MVYYGCPMLASGSGWFGAYANLVVMAVIFSLIFWGIYVLLFKDKAKRK